MNIITRLKRIKSTFNSAIPDSPVEDSTPLQIEVSPLSSGDFAANTERVGRGLFRLDGLAAATLCDSSTVAAAFGRSLQVYDGKLPDHNVWDSARRAFNIALITSLLGEHLDAEQRQKAACAVQHHLVRVPRQFPHDNEMHMVDTLTSWVSAALLWPSLPGSAAVIEQGLTMLSKHYQRPYSDGAPRGEDPSELLAWVELVLMANKLARQNNIELPAGLKDAAGAAAWHLYLRASSSGTFREGQVGPIAGSVAALVFCARDATISLGWSAGSPSQAHDAGALTEYLGGTQPTKPGISDDTQMFTMHSFREAATVVLKTTVRNEPCNIIIDGSTQTLPAPQIELGNDFFLTGDASIVTLLGAEGKQTLPALEIARVNKTKARVLLKNNHVTREMLFQRTRVTVNDTPCAEGPVFVQWQLPGGWSFKRENGRLFAKNDAINRVVKVSLDDILDWKISGKVARGKGSWFGDLPIRASFEWT